MNLNANIELFDFVSGKDKMLFARNLAIMLKSGFTLSDGVEMLASETKNAKLKRIFKNIRKDIERGKSLYESMSAYPEIFDTVTLSLVQVGEQSGTLEENLFFIADTLKKRNEFSSKVSTAMLYPGIVLAVALSAGIGVSIFVLPQLVELFESLNAELPLNTKILLFVARFLYDYGLLLGLAVMVFIVLFQMSLRFSSSLRYGWQVFLLHIPVLSDMIRYMQLTAIARNTGIMIKSGLPIDTAFKTVRDSTANLVYKGMLHTLVSRIDKGDTIAKSLLRVKPWIVPPFAARMIGIGDATGKLEESLLYSAEYFEEELDGYTKNLGAVLEPVLLILVGLVVAFVVSSMLMPIYDFTTNL